MPAATSTRLALELEELNPEQRRAATALGDVVVVAGPGSGKTRTLVARAAFMLETDISPFRGVACLSYTRAAAAEVRSRLRQVGLLDESRVVCETVHAFCLNEILRPYGALEGANPSGAYEVIRESQVAGLLADCFHRLRITDLRAESRLPTLTKIRRAIICEEDLSIFDDREVAAARLYEQALESNAQIDFEAMVFKALSLVRGSEPVRDLLAARFPHLIVDEYQDLGGALHQLVLAMRGDRLLTVAAVGDVDQSIYGFTGAHPRYLASLVDHPDFLPIPLHTNYRSGSKIIEVCEALLGRDAGLRVPQDASKIGLVSLTEVKGDLQEHGAAGVDLARRLASRMALHDIALLYPSKGPLLDAIVWKLKDAQLPFVFERDSKVPEGSLSQFVQACASYALQESTVQFADLSTGKRGNSRIDLHELGARYVRLRSEAGLPGPPTRFWSVRQLHEAFEVAGPVFPASSLPGWLQTLDSSLRLTQLGASHPDRENHQCMQALSALGADPAFTVGEMSMQAVVEGKILLTTYHSSKGREFKAVIVPGLINGVVPRDVPIRGVWGAPVGAELAEQRRTFFVALSRAEDELHLLWGRSYTTKFGRLIQGGPTVFLQEIRDYLANRPAD